MHDPFCGLTHYPWKQRFLCHSRPCAAGAVVGAPFVLAGIGFTSAGIAAGSYAASMMSAAAVANGGAVAAGSTVAVLQAAGKGRYLISNMKCNPVGLTLASLW